MMPSESCGHRQTDIAVYIQLCLGFTGWGFVGSLRPCDLTTRESALPHWVWMTWRLQRGHAVLTQLVLGNEDSSPLFLTLQTVGQGREDPELTIFGGLRSAPAAGCQAGV